MSIFTLVWKLLKKNPETDGNEVFNIETMLNDNWDKIDSALGQKALNADVRAATIASIALNGLQTVDGVALAAGDRVLVKNQTTGSENGIYVAGPAGWARASDADSAGKLAAGVFVHVKEGSANAGTGWILTTLGQIELGITPLIFVQKTGNGSATDAVIGPRTVDPNTSVSYGLSGSVTQLFSWVFKYLKAITGKANPFDPPDMTLAMAKSHVDATAPHSGHAIVSRKVNTAAGLQGGGDLTADRTLSIADSGVTDSHIGTRTIDDTIAATAGADTPTRLWSKLANMVKAITGKSNWYIPPVTSIEALHTNKLNASAYTASDVLAKIKTVDGSGSGLNADGLDGYHADVASNVNTVAVRDANGWITARGLHSDVVQGMAPLVVDSSTCVSNFNADMVDGKHASDFFSSTGGKVNGEFGVNHNIDASNLPILSDVNVRIGWNRTGGEGEADIIVGSGGNGISTLRVFRRKNDGTLREDFMVGNGYATIGSQNVLTNGNHNSSGDPHSQYIKKAGDDGIGTLTGTSFTSTGYSTNGTGTIYPGQWTKVASSTISGQFSSNSVIIDFINGASGSTDATSARVTFRVKQQNSLGSAPIVQVYVDNGQWPLDESDFVAITTVNDSSKTVVDLYVRIKTYYDHLQFYPSLYYTDGGADITCHSNQSFVPYNNLPSGTKTFAGRKSPTLPTRVTDLNVDTTSEKPIIAYVPTSSGNFDVKTYIRLTAPAVVSIRVVYTDASGVEQSTFIVNGQQMNAGSYSLLPVFVSLLGLTQVSVVVTSSVANVVKVSASIVGV
ncbi:hypothetical protein J19TS2_25950 [Cohnella xylanilytica]|uniref:hypothetical protein n=1 Tax=Cohnella xylanilytica TaxID=557555 RepID=UPI001B1FC303|nr:hypothetical protein [Cohnella xylanilytica]GIO13040.1 hypothetical protein J19TS2_25950 [Cohnella xylanilytica]